MRIGTSWLAFGLVAALCSGIAYQAGTARAEDEKKGGPPPVEKAVKHPMFDALLGSWTTTATASWGTAKSRATFVLGVGGTAVLETYDNRMDGAPADTFHGHGIFKVSDDGKTLNLWWLDTHSSEPMKLTGPLTEKGYDVKGTLHGDETRLTFEKKGDGWEFKMYGADGKVMMTEVFTKAPAK
jgi:hypothetical protein